MTVDVSYCKNYLAYFFWPTLYMYISIKEYVVFIITHSRIMTL